MSSIELKALSRQALQVLRKGRPKIKVGFFDVDGTILAIDGNYPPLLPEILSQVRECGVSTGIASGRPTFATQFLRDELGLTGAGVYCTGAQIFSPEEKCFLANHYLPQALCRDLLAAVRTSNIYHEVYTDSGFYIDHNIAPEIREVHREHLRIAPKQQDLGQVIEQEGVLKFLIGFNQAEDNQILQSLERSFPQLQFAYAGLPKYPSWLFASIIDEKASKHAAFEVLLKHYDVTADEVIAFGDAQSDMTFLKLAGVGVAMGNASDSVKAVADFYTLPVWENGLEYALNRLIIEEYVG